MAATWTRLQSDDRQDCASASHGDERAVATWRMESDEGKVGSYYCETCRYLITRGPRYFGNTVPITTTPTKR